jgi:hypothetical protein
MQIGEQGPKAGGPRDVDLLLRETVDRIEELCNSRQRYHGPEHGLRGSRPLHLRACRSPT